MLRKQVRWGLATVGPLLWIGAGVMPLFGGAAEHAYRCRGREYTGTFDDCFNDALPVGEFFAIFLVLITFLFFVAFSRSLFGIRRRSDEPDRYGFNSKPSGVHAIALIGVAWCVWRASTYRFVPELLPFIGFWIVFALWFAIGVVDGWLGKRNQA